MIPVAVLRVDRERVVQVVETVVNFEGAQEEPPHGHLVVYISNEIEVVFSLGELRQAHIGPGVVERCAV